MLQTSQYDIHFANSIFLTNIFAPYSVETWCQQNYLWSLEKTGWQYVWRGKSILLTMGRGIHRRSSLLRWIGRQNSGIRRLGQCQDQQICWSRACFMLREIKKTWQIPLTYKFCKSSTSAKQLIRCIKGLVRAMIGAGFKLIARVCDQGKTNVSCINNLLKETRATCIRGNTVFSKYVVCVCVHLEKITLIKKINYWICTSNQIFLWCKKIGLILRNNSFLMKNSFV